MEILNLDKLLPEPREIILNKKQYKLSGDITVKMALGLFKKFAQFQKDPNSQEAIDAVIKQVHTFFSEYHPDLTLDRLQEILHIRQVAPLVTFLYKSVTEAQAEQEENLTGEKKELTPEEVLAK